jgi:predicted cupin superfamily sugar epimerase
VVYNLLQAAVDEVDGAAGHVKIGSVTAEEIIARLGLKPHPEGGHFVEAFRAPEGTAIYFLLKAGERSHWHKVNADEIWHHYAGAPLELSMSDDGHAVHHLRLGTDFGIGEQPQAVVPRHVWQAARSLGAWTLVGCTVSPAFDFSGFELAPPDWSPSP